MGIHLFLRAIKFFPSDAENFPLQPRPADVLLHSVFETRRASSLGMYFRCWDSYLNVTNVYGITNVYMGFLFTVVVIKVYFVNNCCCCCLLLLVMVVVE